MGRDPQIEKWASGAAPNVGALQQLLSALDDQRVVWSQIRTFRWEGNRGQREVENASPEPRGVTKAEGGGHRAPAAGPDQKPEAGGRRGETRET